MKNLTSERLLVPVAFAMIYIVWGSTYLANWYAIQDIPPLLMSGTRFFTAGGLLVGLSLLFDKTRPTAAQLKNTAINGVMFLAIGTGGMVWAEQYITSGMVALMAAFQPLLVVLLMWWLNGHKPGMAAIAGTVLGMVGMGFLVGQDSLVSGEKTLLGIGIIFISLLSWGVASIRTAKLDLPKSKLMGAGLQMLLGGCALLLASAITGEVAGFQWSNLTERGIWSWVYLVIFGSIVAFSAFNYLLVKSTPDKVATANYVNPVVALLLGWGFNNEAISQQSLLAAVLLLSGVVIINSGKHLIKKMRLARPHPVASLIPELQLEGAELDYHVAKPKPGTIARVWQGKTSQEQAGEYLAWTKQNCVREATATPGNLGVTMLHRTENGITHHTFVSYWQDVEAVKRYAGEDYRRPKVSQADRQWLLEPVGMVEHRTI